MNVQETTTASATSSKASARDSLDTELVERWTKEQLEYRQQLKLFDTEPWQINRQLYDAGSDVENPSFSSGKWCSFILLKFDFFHTFTFCFLMI